MTKPFVEVGRLQLVLLRGRKLRYDRFRRDAALAQRAQGERVMPLGQATPLLIEHQRRVVECGRIPAQRTKKQQLSKGALDQVGATDHFRDTKLGIVDDGRELVARCVVFAPDDKIAEFASGDRALRAAMYVGERNLLLVRYSKPPVCRHGGAERRQRGVSRGTKFTRIHRFVVGRLGWSRISIYRRRIAFILRTERFMWRARRVEHVSSRSCTRKNQSGRMQPFQCRTIAGGACALRNHLSIPSDAEPLEVLLHCSHIFRPATRAIEIVVAQTQRPGGGASAMRRDPKRPRMPEVQKTRGRRRQPAAVRRTFFDHEGYE